MTEAILHKPPARWPVILIGFGKLAKSLSLAAVAFGVGWLLRPDQRAALEDFLVHQAQLTPYAQYLHVGLVKVLAIPEKQLHVLRVASVIYAGLYLIEGTGLLFDLAWAEWMVIVTTAGFLPLEIYEIIDRLTWVRLTVLLLNLVVVAYLCVRVWQRRRVNRQRRALAHTGSTGPQAGNQKPADGSAVAPGGADG